MQAGGVAASSLQSHHTSLNGSLIAYDIDDAQGKRDSMSSGRAGSKAGQVTASEELVEGKAAVILGLKGMNRNVPLRGCGSPHAQSARP